MGSGNFNTKQYYNTAASYQKQERTALFQPNLVDDFNPLKIKIRESCASKEHPDPTSIIIACDVTGSMGKIPENLLKGGLGKIMESLLKIKSISNPQVMFAAIGDTECDRAPLQATQFESDNRIEEQLKKLYLEGGGGGNNMESYNIIWYFAARKTQLDSWKAGKKGLLFTMGDEMMPVVLKADHIRKFIDKDYKGTDIATSELIKEAAEKYEVFHLIVQDTNTYTRLGAENVNACWRQYLGERAILVPKYEEIPQKIVSTVRTLSELNLLNDKPLEHKSEANDEIKIPQNVKGDTEFFKVKSNNAANLASVLNKDSDNIPRLFICPITQDVMKEPVIAQDGYTYERQAITDWFKKKPTSPMTNEIIGKLLTSNNSLKSEIKLWQDNQAVTSIKSTGIDSLNQGPR